MKEKTEIKLMYIIGKDYTGYTGTKSIEMTLGGDANITDMMQAYRSFLLAIGYHNDNVEENIPAE